MKSQILDQHEVKSAEMMNHCGYDVFQLLSEAVLHDAGRPHLKCEQSVRLDFDIVFDERERVERRKDVDVDIVGC